MNRDGDALGYPSRLGPRTPTETMAYAARGLQLKKLTL